MQEVESYYSLDDVLARVDGLELKAKFEKRARENAEKERK